MHMIVLPCWLWQYEETNKPGWTLWKTLCHYVWVACSFRMIAALSASLHKNSSYHFVILMMFHGHPHQGTTQNKWHLFKGKVRMVTRWFWRYKSRETVTLFLKTSSAKSISHPVLICATCQADDLAHPWPLELEQTNKHQLPSYAA